MESQLHILVANEPSTYRQLLATELPLLRPQFCILSVDPDHLDTAVAQLRPLLVICSRMTEAIRGRSGATIVLYPGGADIVVAEAGEHLQVLLRPRLSDLLAAIDAVIGASAAQV